MDCSAKTCNQQMPEGGLDDDRSGLRADVPTPFDGSRIRSFVELLWTPMVLRFPDFEVPIQVCLLVHLQGGITIYANAVVVEKTFLLEGHCCVKGRDHVQVVPDNVVDVHLKT